MAANFSDIEKISFTESMKEYLHVYFHFLDGYLNPNQGFNTDLIYKHLNNKQLVKQSNNLYKLNNISPERIFLKKFNNDDYLEKKWDEINETDYDNILTALQYCIVNNNYNTHATTMIFFIKNDNLYFLSVNSGEGIKFCHKKNNDKYLPYIGLLLQTNINDNIINGLFKIRSILSIPHLYDYISTNDILLTRRPNEEKYDIAKLKNTLLYIKNIAPTIDENILTLEMDNKKYTSINDILHIENTKTNILSLKNNMTYYQLFCKIIDNSDKKNNLELKNIVKNISSFNIEVSDIRIKDDKITDVIMNKIILHYIDNDLYINSQESGSCTWFSIYWTLILYYVIHHDVDAYLEFVKNINIVFFKIIENIFTYKQYLDEFSNPDCSVATMDIFWKKLMDNNLLDEREFSLSRDAIYDINTALHLDTNLENIDDYNFEIQKNIDIMQYINRDPLKKYRKKLSTMDNTVIHDFLYDYIIQKKYTISSEDMARNNSQNTELLIIFELYLVKNDFFNDIFINSETINEYLDNIKFVDPVTKFNNQIYIDNINNNINIFNKIIEIENIDDYYPILIKKYYHYFVYLSELYKNHNYFFIDSKIDNFRPLLSFHDNPSQLKKFFIFYMKFTILINLVILGNVFFYMTENHKSNMINYYNILINQISDIGDRGINLSQKIKYDISTQINTELFIKFDIYKYKNYLEYLLNNPKLIFEKIINYSYSDQDMNTNDYFLIDNSFFKFFIPYIFRNEKLRNDLLKYFCEQYFNNSTKGREILLLLTGKLNFASDLLIFETIDVDIIKILNSIKTNKNVDQFTEYIIKEKNNIIILNKLSIINKYIPNTKITDNYLSGGDGKYYFLIKSNNIFYKIFNFNSSTTCIYKHVDPQSTKSSFYILTNQFKIEFEIKLSTNDYSDRKINIKKLYAIKYNDNLIYKYNDLITLHILPFIHTMPLISCNTFIYNLNNTYYITYFKNNLFYTENSILGSYTIDDNELTFMINNNNLFFPTKMNNDLYDKFILLCKNYGFNKFNISFYKKPKYENTKTNITVAFCENTKIYDSYITTDSDRNELQNIKNLKINFYEKTNDSNNISFDKYIDSEDVKYFFKNPFKDCNDPIIQKITIEDDEQTLKEMNSLKKLFNKIKKCYDKKNYVKLYSNIKNIDKLQFDSQKEIYNSITKKYKSFNTLFSPDNYTLIYKYVSLLRLSNICRQLDIFSDSENICSKIKIYNEQMMIRQHEYNYLFEFIFEFLFGYEITNEQYEKYTSIIRSTGNDYNSKNKIYSGEEINVIPYYEQIGGNNQLHHFMMGKGKSSVITPLLTLYYTLQKNLNVYIIVPDHLVNQTKNTMATYINFFNIENNVKILSDSEIKLEFLNGVFMKEKIRQQSIFLIDEFDTILDPLKSNFNLSNDKNIDVTKIYKIINYIIEYLNHIKITVDSINESVLKNINLQIFEKDFSLEIIDIIKNDISNILLQIKNGYLKENINWGIHFKKCIAIPYLNKDKPLLNSNFSSCITTIFLTLYYFSIYKNYEFSDLIINYINVNRLNFYLFENITITSREKIEEYFIRTSTISKKEIFNKIFEYIIDTIKLSKNQYNTSFVDIINLDDIIKIGYSGTLNVELPPIDIEFDSIIEDVDEKLNIKYAILNSHIVEYFNNINTYSDNDLFVNDFITNENLGKYSALIDASGLFKNIDNEIIATILHNNLIESKENFNEYGYVSQILHKRPIIYIDSNDNKMVIENDIKMNFNENTKYDNPFIYYSQTHIVGIDIPQENYPSMIGLCIIDDKTLYTTVAQAIFRLRKLNMGHTIDFYILNKNKIENLKSSRDIYSYLKNNDAKNRENKHDILMFQSMKSIIRKNNFIKLVDTDLSNFKEVYKEENKYYYFMNTINSNINSTISHIFNEDDIIFLKQKNKSFERILKDLDIIKKLIYNINSLLTEFTNDLEQENEKQKETEKEQHLELLHNRDNFVRIPILQLLLDYKIYDNIDINLDNYCIKVDKYVYIMPDIFSNYNYYRETTLEINNVNTLFYYVYIKEKNVLLLINSDSVMYFYDKYPILNMDLNLINLDFSIYIKKDFYDYFTKNILVKLFYIDTIKDPIIIEDLNILYYLIILYSTQNFISISENQKKIIDEFLTKYPPRKGKKNISFYSRIKSDTKNINSVINEFEKKIPFQNIDKYHIKDLSNSDNVTLFFYHLKNNLDLEGGRLLIAKIDKYIRKINRLKNKN